MAKTTVLVGRKVRVEEDTKEFFRGTHINYSHSHKHAEGRVYNVGYAYSMSNGKLYLGLSGGITFPIEAVEPVADSIPFGEEDLEKGDLVYVRKDAKTVCSYWTSNKSSYVGKYVRVENVHNRPNDLPALVTLEGMTAFPSEALIKVAGAGTHARYRSSFSKDKDSSSKRYSGGQSHGSRSYGGYPSGHAGGATGVRYSHKVRRQLAPTLNYEENLEGDPFEEVS